MNIRAVQNGFVGEVTGIDICKPLPATRWRRSSAAWTSTPC